MIRMIGLLHMPRGFLLTLVLAAAGTSAAQTPTLAHLLDNPESLANPKSMTVARGQHVVAFQGQPGESGFNLHSYLAYFDGRFFLCWSSAREHEEGPDQHLMYATSVDGHTWTPAKVLVEDPDGAAGPKRWIARGMFVEGGKLYALGALVESADYKNQGTGEVWHNLQLIRFRWTGKDWARQDVFADNCMNNFPPLTEHGSYIMPCRDRDMKLAIAKRPLGSTAAWSTTPIYQEPPFTKMDEPMMYFAADGSLQLVIRDSGHSGYLLRAMRERDGKWATPVRSNYPDATSKNFITRLSTGEYVLISNPNQKARDPLAITFSHNGWEFGHPLALRTSSQYPGSPAGMSFQYPHAMEHGGSLWVAYSINKRDIEVSEYKLSDLKEQSH